MPAIASTSVLLPGQPVAGPSGTSSTPSLPRAGTGTYRRGEYVLSSLIGYRDMDAGSAQGASASGKGKAPEPREQVVSVQGTRARFPVPQTDSTVSGSARERVRKCCTPRASAHTILPPLKVLARVIRVSPRQATCTILVVDGVPCGVSTTTAATSSSSHSIPTHLLLGGSAATDDGNPDNLFQGVIRSQDVRATNKDSVRMSECFRPGDIVRATVISLGDARSYYLSTASNELGVVYAIAASSSAPDYILLGDDADAGRRKSSAAPLRSRPEAVPLQPLNWAEMQDPSTGAIEKRKVAKPLVV